MKKQLVVLLVTIVLLAENAGAGELTLKTAERFFSAINIRSSVAHMADIMGKQMSNRIQYLLMQDLKKKGISDNDIKTGMRVFLTNAVDVKNVMLSNFDQLLPCKEIVAEIYYPVLKNHFSEEEIIELTNFYQTPLGRKVTAEMPEMMRESAQLLSQSPKYIPKINKFLIGEWEKRRDTMNKEIDLEIEKARGKQENRDK